MLPVVLVLAAAPWAEGTDPAAGVERARLVHHVQRLQETRSRVTTTPGAEVARRYVEAVLTRAGLDPHRRRSTVVHPFIADRTVVATNVVVDVGGVGAPLFLVAHLDSKAANTMEEATSLGWNPATDPAPGADDNASGVAALLEVAVLVRPARRVVLVFSDAEELAIIAPDGFMENLGADAIAADAPPGSRVIAVDMLLRAKPWGSSLRIYEDGRARSARLADALIAVAQLVAPEVEMNRIVDPSFTFSDHGSFWANGFGGVLFIEDDFHHKRYHRRTDHFDPKDTFYSIEQLEAATKILVAAVRWLSSA